jgi:hypothetical protein
MSWFSRVFGNGFTVSVVTNIQDSQPNFIYRERKRKMRITGETMADGYAVYSASIKHWEGQPDVLVDETERQRIASNVQQYLASKGKSVYLS